MHSSRIINTHFWAAYVVAEQIKQYTHKNVCYEPAMIMV
jgi:hypothetical protein